MNESKPTLIIVAGPNGSGKTSVTGKILQHEWVETCEYINPDNIARDVYGDWNEPGAVLKAANKAAEMREQCLADRKSMIFETVLSAVFFVRLFFVGTNNPTINAGRVARRVMEGGHDVPITKIVSRYSKSIANCCVAA